MFLFAADGDSNSISKVNALEPYGPDCPVEKIDCRNHLFRNLDKKIRYVISNTKYPILCRKRLKKELPRFRKDIVCAAQHWRESTAKENEKIENLEKDILNSARHILNDHENCACVVIICRMLIGYAVI